MPEANTNRLKIMIPNGRATSPRTHFLNELLMNYRKKISVQWKLTFYICKERQKKKNILYFKNIFYDILYAQVLLRCKKTKERNEKRKNTKLQVVEYKKHKTVDPRQLKREDGKTFDVYGILFYVNCRILVQNQFVVGQLKSQASITGIYTCHSNVSRLDTQIKDLCSQKFNPPTRCKYKMSSLTLVAPNLNTANAANIHDVDRKIAKLIPISFDIVAMKGNSKDFPNNNKIPTKKMQDKHGCRNKRNQFSLKLGLLEKHVTGSSTDRKQATVAFMRNLTMDVSLLTDSRTFVTIAMDLRTTTISADLDGFKDINDRVKCDGESDK
ncbi:hypothetical protein WN51_06526 [Melipona quadrifasciata]|uniref:Uncharacterized protein n=1 Tax=Melipona quadrifasciata TaxID=166423 RepID=A0A0M8ZQS8_9HYME|nr:hypothetical protein WN51_06526 [Melipona quadrifasciata]